MLHIMFNTALFLVGLGTIFLIFGIIFSIIGFFIKIPFYIFRGIMYIIGKTIYILLTAFWLVYEFIWDKLDIMFWRVRLSIKRWWHSRFKKEKHHYE
jgi:cytochrome c biogenesis protein CcdA